MVIDRDTKKALRWATGDRVPKPQPPVRGADYAMSYACLTCRTAQKRHVEGHPSDYPLKMECPICKEAMFNLGRHFKAPAKSDFKQWKKVAFLIEHGFLFQKIRPDKDSYESVRYPETLEDAREFVAKYRRWAYKGGV